MNTLFPNHKFIFSDGERNLFIINGRVFLEKNNGEPEDLRLLNPCKKSVSNHVISSITKTLEPHIILSILRKKTLSLKWKIVSS